MGARITGVTTRINEVDLLNNIREFAKVEGLRITETYLRDDKIEIAGVFHKVIDIPFKVAIKVLKVYKNIITLELSEIKVLKLGIPQLAIQTAATALKDKLKSFGVSVEDKIVTIYVDKALEAVKHVKVNIDDVKVENGVLLVSVTDINADVEKMKAEKEKEEAIKKAKLVEEIKSEGVSYTDEAQVNGVMRGGMLLSAEDEARKFNEKINEITGKEDEYTRFRRDLYKKMPSSAKGYYKYLALIPDIAALGVRTIMDDRVLKKDKVLLGVSLGYVISPIDIIPDKFPLLGKFDDLALFVFGTNHLLNRIPLPIIVENWSGDLKTLKFVKDNIGKIMGVVGANNIERVYGFIDDKLDKKFGTYLDDSYYFRNADTKTIVADMTPVVTETPVVIEEEDIEAVQNDLPDVVK